MRNKKANNSPSPDAELEKRVDAMMDPAQPDSIPAPAASSSGGQTDTPPPLDIFADVKNKSALEEADKEKAEPGSAPAVPAALLKPLAADAKEASEKPAKAEPAEPVTDTPALPEATEEAASQTEEASVPATGTEDKPADLPPAELDDEKSDAAVDDIVAHESDQVLAAEDLLAAKAEPVATKKAGKSSGRFKQLFARKRTWLVLLTLVIAIVAAVPYSRYKVLGLALKRTVNIQVVDSKTGTPVSRATVSADGRSIATDANGKATLALPVGTATLQVSEQYYRTAEQSFSIGLKGAAAVHISLAATGRQVPVAVVNTISGQPVAGAVIAVLNTSAKTNSKGMATIVLPASADTDKATVSASGYNQASTSITVTDTNVPGNSFKLTPSGKVYFLSNASGKIDVVKTNLDGTDRGTVVAGTGQEDANNTSLLASPDWRYLVLESQRSGSQPALYIIDTSTGKLTGFDNSQAGFTLVGWVGDSIIYDALKTNLDSSTPGREAIKSYDAATGQLYQLDQDQVTGSGSDYAYQGFQNFALTDGALIYTATWYASGSADLSGQSDTIRTVLPNGHSKKDLVSQPAAGSAYFQDAVYQPGVIYYEIYNYVADKTTFFTYQNGTVGPSTSLSSSSFNQDYPVYRFSPDGKQTFWSQLRDGQDSLFVGDSSGQNSHAINTAGDYKAFGWYGTSYLLATDKDGSQLFVLPAAAQAGQVSPLKISDYFSSAPHTYGYAGF